MELKNEIYLWRQLDTVRLPRDVIDDMLEKGMINNYKQAVRTLEKWWVKGLYDYGVSIDTGWRVCPSEKRQIIPRKKLVDMSFSEMVEAINRVS